MKNAYRRRRSSKAWMSYRPLGTSLTCPCDRAGPKRWPTAPRSCCRADNGGATCAHTRCVYLGGKGHASRVRVPVCDPPSVTVSTSVAAVAVPVPDRMTFALRDVSVRPFLRLWCRAWSWVAQDDLQLNGCPTIASWLCLDESPRRLLLRSGLHPPCSREPVLRAVHRSAMVSGWSPLSVSSTRRFG